MTPGPGEGTPDVKWPEHRPDGKSANAPSEATPDTPGGAPHGEPMKRSAIQGKGDQPSDLTPNSRPDAEWQRAEHISEASIVSDSPGASTGSAGLAKQQVETARQRAEDSPPGRRLDAQTNASQSVSPSANPQAGGPPSAAAGIDPRAHDRAQRQSQASTTSAGSTSAAAYPAGKGNSKDDLAQKLGFASFLEFFEGSQPLSSEQNNVWYTSALPGNQWVLWNSQTLEYSRPLPTLEQAKQASNYTG